MGVNGSGDHPSDTLGRSRDAGLRGLREEDQLLRLALLPLYSHLDGCGAEKLREAYFPSLSLNSSSANRLLDEICAFQTMLRVRIIWGKFEKKKKTQNPAAPQTNSEPLGRTQASAFFRLPRGFSCAGGVETQA